MLSGLLVGTVIAAIEIADHEATIKEAEENAKNMTVTDLVINSILSISFVVFFYTFFG